MSRIYFHNIEETTEVSGCERGLLGQLCSNALLFALGELDYGYGAKPPWIMNHIPKECHLHGDMRATRSLISAIKTWLKAASGQEARLILGESSHPLFHLQLNSATIFGGDAFKLAARLHGQCEIHCYVEGSNRAWMASMVEDALNKSIYRRDMGWESVCALLRKANDSPVVCSYSVCDSFPNRHVAEWQPEADGEDAWYELPKEKQWELALAGLRKDEGGLELMPDNWGEYYFGEKLVTGFDFRNQHEPAKSPLPTVKS